jgi:hypothetical protein
MTEALAKVRRLLDAGTRAFRAQAAEMVIMLDDPEVDAWVLAGVGLSGTKDTATWDRPPASRLSHRSLSDEAVLAALGRATTVDAGPIGRLTHLYVGGSDDDDRLDAAPYSRIRSLESIVLRPPAIWAHNWRHNALEQSRPVPGLDALADLPALTDLAIVGGAGIDLAVLAGLPHLRRLSLYGCSVTAGAADLSGTALTRIDLGHVPGLAALRVPPTLHRLEVEALPDLSHVDGLGAGRLTDLSIVDAPAVTTLPELPASVRRVRLGCPQLTSVAPLAGIPLDTLDLTGCAALESLDGVVAAGTELSLAGCRRLTDLAPLESAAALRVLDLRDARAVADLAPLDALPELAVIAVHGTATRPDTVPAGLLAACTWAHTPDLDLLGRRGRVTI